MNDFDKQREKNQVRSDLQDANWDLQSFESRKDISVMVYLFDYFDSGDLMMAGLREIDMKGLTEVEHSMEDITGSLDEAFKSYVLASSKKKREWTNILGGILGLYMVNTKTYNQLKNTPVAPGQMKHFIVLRYKHRHSNVASFRPLSLVSDKKVMSPEEIRQLALSVIERDEAMNAGFFNFSPVAKLKE